MREVTFNFPVQVIAHILGLPRADYPRFQRWAIELTSVTANWERGMAASAALRDYFAEVMAERRATPGDDLISELVRVEVDGRALDDEEIYSFLRLLLPAGVETTYRASGSLLFALLQRPDPVRGALRRPLALPAGLRGGRCAGSHRSRVILRRATRDTELAGVPIEEGADIALLIGAANRDERKYTDPDRYDMFREQRQHVGFGFGVHVCLGMHLARMESRVAINTLFDRLGPFTLGPGRRAAPHRGNGLPLAALAPGGVRSPVTPAEARFGRMGGRANPLRDAAAIVGIGQTEFAKEIDRPEGQLAAEAVVAALRDAGIAPGEVDGLSRSRWSRPTRSPWPRTSGQGTSRTSPRSATAAAPGAPPSGMRPWRSPPGRPRSSWRGGRASAGPAAARPWAAAPSRLPMQGQWTRPFGLLRPVDEVAMLARRYMYEYGGDAGAPGGGRAWRYAPTPTATRRR